MFAYIFHQDFAFFDFHILQQFKFAAKKSAQIRATKLQRFSTMTQYLKTLKQLSYFFLSEIMFSKIKPYIANEIPNPQSTSHISKAQNIINIKV